MSEEQKKKELEEKAQSILKRMTEIIANAKGEEDTKAFDKPVNTSMSMLVTKPNNSAIKTQIAVFQTKTFLDQFFLDNDEKILNGIPKVVQIGIVGNPDVGKSLISQEVILRLASEGHKTVFCTSEDVWETQNERLDLQSRMKQKADIMGLDWQKITANLFVLDIISRSSLRDWQTLVGTYRQLVENEKIEYLVIDSLTLLDDYRAGLKFHLGEFCSYNQLHGVSAFYISQKATEDAVDQFGMSGGIGLSHLLDVVFEINFKKVWSGDSQMKSDTDSKQGDILHFIRLLKCRLTRADMRYHKLEITKDGFLKLIK